MILLLGFYLLLGCVLYARYGDDQDGLPITCLVAVCFIFLYPFVLANAAIND